MIWLHPEGDEGEAWCRVQWGLVFEWVNFIFPNAKVQDGPVGFADSKGKPPPPPYLNRPPGMDQNPVNTDEDRVNVTRSWFSLRPAKMGESGIGVEEEESLSRSAAFVLAHVQAEVDKGIDPKRIFIIGFGQGGATVRAPPSTPASLH